jgi:glycosyltransferase involved in cell wall biosynthesis
LTRNNNSILLVQVGVGFLHPNRSIIAQLKKYFPDADVELFDVLPLIRRDYPFLFVNMLYVFKEYFFDFITFRKSIRDIKYYFLGTTYIFKKLSSLIKEHVADRKYRFIMQSQCMCDSSVVGNTPVFIYTDHTSLFNLKYRFTSPHKYLRTKSYIALEKQAYESAASVLVMSRNIQESLIEQYGIDPAKVHQVYVGTNTPLPESVDESKYLNQNIIFVGKDWERKGGPVLVEAFKKIQKELPDAKLTIVGCKPDIHVKNCIIVGDVSLKEVAYHYNKASVFCLPTKREPFGIVFLEAMFNKLPIVTNNMGAAPYLVQPDRNGYLIENDADQYARVLIGLLANPEKCRAFGEASYAIAKSKYTWDNVGKLMYTHICRQLGETSLLQKSKVHGDYSTT